MSKQVVIQVVAGNFETGFSVSLQIREKGKPIHTYAGKLPANLELMPCYEEWREAYYHNPTIRNNGIRDHRAIATWNEDEHIPQRDYKTTQKTFENTMTKWLRSYDIRDIATEILLRIQPNDKAQLIILCDNPDLQQLPWQVWDIFTSHKQMEVSFANH